uniref:Ig-like domain-containing protein n=1 Tax=Terrapene triunguis TaxID=2587831 RepID=A0A674JHI7_9SAUR
MEGSSLALTNAKSTPPSVFPLVPCCTQTGSAPPDTSLACLVTGYLPSPVDITWNSGKVTQGVKNFPEVTMSDGLHTRSSLLILPDRSRQGDTYQCDVTPQGTAKTVSKKFPQECKTCGVGGRDSQAEIFKAPRGSGSQLILIHIPLIKVLNVNVPHQGGGFASAGRTVELALSLEGDWGSTERDTGLCFPLSLLSACGSTTPPQVHLLAPTCEDSSTESQLELVCLLLSFKPGEADVKWLVNGKESSPPTPAFSSAMGTDGFYMGQSRMNVTKQSWEKGDVYTCQVTHPAVGTELSMHNTSKCLGEGLRPSNPGHNHEQYR